MTLTIEQVVAALAPFVDAINTAERAIRERHNGVLPEALPPSSATLPWKPLQIARTVHTALTAANTLPPTLAEQSRRAVFANSSTIDAGTMHWHCLRCGGQTAHRMDLPELIQHTSDCLISQLDRVIADRIAEQDAEIARLKRRSDELDARIAFENASATPHYELEPGYSWAVGELTRRKAWDKSAIAVIIAEQRNRVASLEALLRTARDRIAKHVREYDSGWIPEDTIEGHARFVKDIDAVLSAGERNNGT